MHQRDNKFRILHFSRLIAIMVLLKKDLKKGQMTFLLLAELDAFVKFLTFEKVIVNPKFKK